MGAAGPVGEFAGRRGSGRCGLRAEPDHGRCCRAARSQVRCRPGAAAAIFGVATFSPGALTAPALAGLSRFPGTRGRIRFAKDDHTIGQRPQGATPQKPPAEICTPLCVWRKGLMVQIRQFAQMEPYDDLLFIVPLSQFRR